MSIYMIEKRSEVTIPISHIRKRSTTRILRCHLLCRQEAKCTRPGYRHMRTIKKREFEIAHQEWVLAPQTIADSPSPECKYWTAIGNKMSIFSTANFFGLLTLVKGNETRAASCVDGHGRTVYI